MVRRNKQGLLWTALAILTVGTVFVEAPSRRAEGSFLPPEASTAAASLQPAGIETGSPGHSERPVDSRAGGSVDRQAEPPDWHETVDRLVGDEQNIANVIAMESLETTLTNMVDFPTNYRVWIPGPDAGVTSGYAVQTILYSRRFAKLMEDTQGVLSDSQKATIVGCLRKDIAKVRQLLDEDRAHMGGWSDGWSPEEAGEFLEPLSYRMSATELLIGQRAIVEALPVIIESVNVRLEAEIPNWVAAGYACDKILCAIDPSSVAGEQREILETYLRGRPKRLTREGSLLQYRTVEMPSFRAPVRPRDRASILGAREDHSRGTIIIEIPPDGGEGMAPNLKLFVKHYGSLTDVLEFAIAFLDAGGQLPEQCAHLKDKIR